MYEKLQEILRALDAADEEARLYKQWQVTYQTRVLVKRLMADIEYESWLKEMA